MRPLRRVFAAALVTCSIAGGIAITNANSATAAPNTSAVALTAAGQLVPLGITPGAPPTVAPGTPVNVTGLVGTQQLVGIDYRPANGSLVGVGVDAAGSASVYTINATTGVATPAGAPVTLTAAPSWGVDFNPTVDRIRVVSSTGKNYRLNPNNGALAQSPSDGNLAFVAADSNFGDTPAIASAAYTNNFGAGAAGPTDARATTFFALDAFNDALVAVEAPNNGELRTVGALGTDIDVNAEFDITTNGLAYALVNAGGSETLRTVNLTTGALGAASAPISLGSAVVGFAIETGATPVTAGDDGYAVTDAGSLVTFELTDPSTTTTIGSITGIPAGFAIEGIDTRPATGALFAIAVNPTTGRGKLVTIDRVTAAATAVGAADFAVTPATDYGFDFNPTVDRIRFVTSGGQNLRLHPDTGALAAADGNLAYNAGDPVTASPVLTSTAYANSFAPVAGTIHYGVDAAQDSIVTFTDSNAGKLKTVAKLSLTATPFDVVGDTGLDVATDGRVFFAADQAGVARLFTLNPITGALTAVGANNQIGAGTALRAFAIGRNYVRPTLTITADNKSRAFGTANPTFTFTATGFVGSDTIANIDTPPTCTTTAVTNSSVGSYPITCAGGADDRYNFTYVGGTLTIGQTTTFIKLSPPIRLLDPLVSINLASVNAALYAANGTPIAGAPITFTAGPLTSSSAPRTLCSATTNAGGVATCRFTAAGKVAILLNNGYSASFAGNADLAGSSASTKLIAR